jgi:RimJ/RimL family protein N-acetyltransferase
MPGPVFLNDGCVELRSLEEDDLDLLHRMVNNPDIRRMISVNLPTTRQQQRDWYENHVADEDGGVHFIIAHEGEAVGTVWLHHKSLHHPETNVIVFVAEKHWGNRYGTNAVRLVINYAFDELRKHRVETSVYGINERSKRICERLGLVKEAVHRECAFIDGEYVDVHVYRVLEDEWAERSS